MGACKRPSGCVCDSAYDRSWCAWYAVAETDPTAPVQAPEGVVTAEMVREALLASVDVPTYFGDAMVKAAAAHLSARIASPSECRTDEQAFAAGRAEGIEAAALARALVNAKGWDWDAEQCDDAFGCQCLGCYYESGLSIEDVRAAEIASTASALTAIRNLGPDRG